MIMMTRRVHRQTVHRRVHAHASVVYVSSYFKELLGQDYGVQHYDADHVQESDALCDGATHTSWQNSRRRTAIACFNFASRPLYINTKTFAVTGGATAVY
jgi:hypothetical protein